jgi:hypothetical protein
MKSLRNVGDQPAGTPLLADDVLEFHAARLLLLFKVCGTAGRIDGLTKMAKLDFFVRYPRFFEEVRHWCGPDITASRAAPRGVESSMVRFHYGPWDHRYYHILGYLESKGLLTVDREGKMYRLVLTDLGKDIATQAESNSTFAGLVSHMKQVKSLLGGKAGSTLKKMIYEIFGQEVADRPLGETIE